MKRLLLSAALAWPLLAGRLTLEQALEKAGSANPDIQKARLRVLESEAQALVRRAALRPQLSVGASGAQQTSNLTGIGLSGQGLPSRVGPYTVFDARPRVTQTVLDLSLLAAWRAAKERGGVARDEAEAMAEQTRAAVVDVYLRALAADSRARAAEARATTARALWSQVSAAEAAGTSSKLDVARAAQRMESEQVTVVLSRRDRDALVTLLKKTIGLEQGEAVELVDVEAAGPEPEARVRAEARALESKRRALVEEKKQAERERWPKLSAVADYGVLGQSPIRSLSTYTLGVSLTIPVWTSGRIENEIKAAGLRIAQVDQERRALDLATAQEVARAQIERDAAHEAGAVTARAAAAARQSLELARLRHGAGLTTNLDVITAQGELAQAEEEAIRVRYEGLLASARLAQALGDVSAFAKGGTLRGWI
ncbi:MAG: TolC family protein [Acidobacteria bacterium]|nr:TolC family protein [Acidobacteriota bacterium]